jgi:hypothetical protein
MNRSEAEAILKQFDVIAAILDRDAELIKKSIAAARAEIAAEGNEKDENLQTVRRVYRSAGRTNTGNKIGAKLLVIFEKLEEYADE